MLFISKEDLATCLPIDRLIDAIEAGFRSGIEAPPRLHYSLPCKGETAMDASFLIMPAWRPGEYIGLKILSVFPKNAEAGIPTISGLYILLDGKNGQTIAIIDGGELTARRTAAASALASRLLSRRDSRTLLMVGTGRLAPHLILAHASVRPIDNVYVWGRNYDKAQQVAGTLGHQGFSIRAVDDLPAFARHADIISCATFSKLPLIKGEWLMAGAHVDLVGSYLTDMREADDEVMRRARIFVDSRQGAIEESGDLHIPISNNVISPEDIVADLFDLCRSNHAARASESEITVFKSVGHAIEDLAAAVLASQMI